MTPKEYDWIRLQDGRTGVIMTDYDGVHFCVEIDMSEAEAWEADADVLLPTIHKDDIVEIK